MRGEIPKLFSSTHLLKELPLSTYFEWEEFCENEDVLRILVRRKNNNNHPRVISDNGLIRGEKSEDTKTRPIRNRKEGDLVWFTCH